MAVMDGADIVALSRSEGSAELIESYMVFHVALNRRGGYRAPYAVGIANLRYGYDIGTQLLTWAAEKKQTGIGGKLVAVKIAGMTDV